MKIIDGSDQAFIRHLKKRKSHTKKPQKTRKLFGTRSDHHGRAYLYTFIYKMLLKRHFSIKYVQPKCQKHAFVEKHSYQHGGEGVISFKIQKHQKTDLGERDTIGEQTSRDVFGDMGCFFFGGGLVE